MWEVDAQVGVHAYRNTHVMTPFVHRQAPALALATVVAVALAACGGGEPVAVPGLAQRSASHPPPAAEQTFTPVARVAVASPVDPPPTTSGATTTTEPPATTVAPASAITAAGPATATLPNPVPVLAAVSGWPAFDLHLQTLITAGSDAVSATVLHNGEVVHEVALGHRTTSDDPVSIGDRFRVASISKVMTSITVLRLVQAGRLDLDGPVGERLARRVGAVPSSGVAEITPRHLLTHRSGLAQYEDLMFRREVESCDEAAATGLRRPLERVPGTTLRYSNLNFCLLGLLIEEITDRPYVDVVRDELLAPLGLDGMRLAGTFDVRDGDVEHRSVDGRNYMEVLGAAGSWIASPTDVATIIDALDITTAGWKPLGSDLLAAMTTITVDPPAADPADPGSVTTAPAPPPARGYGMGLMIFGPGSYGHTGTLESTHAMTARRTDGYTWAITVSGDQPSSSRDLAAIMDDALRYATVLTD